MVLALLLAAAPFAGRFLAGGPPPPPKNADLAVLSEYYLTRIKNNPADTAAYGRLASVNEQRGFYIAALDRVDQSRALGVDTPELSGVRGRCLVQLARFDEALPELEAAARARPDSVEAAVDLAQMYWEMDRLPDAAKVLRYFLEHHPELRNSPPPERRLDIERLMVSFAHAGDSENAVQMAKEIIRFSPTDPGGYAVAGKHLLLLKRSAEAANQLKEAVRLAPNVPELRYLHGMALASLGRRDEGLKEWQKAVELNIKATDAWFSIGREYERRKDYRRAGIAFMRAGDNADRGADPYQRAARMWKLAGNPIEAAYCDARAGWMVSDYKGALPHYLFLSRQRDRYWQKEGQLGAAECYLKLENKARYFEFTRAASIEGSTEDLLRVADAYGEVKNYAKRTEYLRKVMEKDPGMTGHYYHQLGVLAEAGGNRDEAEQMFERASQADPQIVEYQRKLADLYLERRAVGNRGVRAVKAAERVVEIGQPYGKDYVRLGLAYKAVNDLPRALQALQHAVDLDPGYGPAYMELGRLYKQLGSRKRGEAMLAFYRKYQSFDVEKQNLRTRALARPQDPRVWEELADYFVKTRDLAGAADFYEKAVRLNPDNPALRAKLIKTFGMMGRPEGPKLPQTASAGHSR